MSLDSEVEVPVAAPPDHVFALLTDPRRLPEWQVEVTEAEVLGGGPVAPDARIREVRRVAGRSLEQVVRVAVHEPPHRFGLRIEHGRVPIHGDWELVPDGDDRTLVRVRAFGELPGPLRVAAPLVARLARRQLRRQHERLRDLAEAGAATPAR